MADQNEYGDNQICSKN
ncbi:hypothetical protein YPPY102_2496, partial [Yersinia pestis PY-102]